MINFNKLSQLFSKKIPKDSIVFTRKTKLWCKLPYPDHKKGCPNYGKHQLCPPNTPYLEDLKGEYNFFYLIYVAFDFSQYKKQRKEEHPKWSERQLSCVLYWQNSIRKILKEYIKKIIESSDLYDFYLLCCGSGFNDKHFGKYQEIVYSMESVGIDVIKTVLNNNIKIEIKPKSKVMLVSLLCSNKELIPKRNNPKSAFII